MAADKVQTSPTVPTELYMVQNSEGKWFRRKGYGGFGDSWVEDWRQGRVYTRIGGARGVVSFFANRYPQYPPPKVAALLIAGGIRLMDESERIEEQKRKKAEAEIKRAARNAKWAEERARHDLEDAQRRLEELRRKR